MVGVSDAGQIQRSVKLIVFLIAMSTVVMFVSIRTRFGSEASSQPCTKSGAQQTLRILELRKKIVQLETQLKFANIQISNARTPVLQSRPERTQPTENCVQVARDLAACRTGQQTKKTGSKDLAQKGTKSRKCDSSVAQQPISAPFPEVWSKFTEQTNRPNDTSAKVGSEMLDFRIFITTYKSDADLYDCLDGLFRSDIMVNKNRKFKGFTHEIYVMNNFGIMRDKLPERYRGRVTVLDNMRRGDFSTGHLAQDWNTCIINGFQDLNKPRSKIVVCMQADNVVEPFFGSILRRMHFEEKYVLVNAGVGDAVTSYVPEAIKRIGLWDERFSNIGWQDYDYWFRAINFAGDAICFSQKTSGEIFQASAFPCKGMKRGGGQQKLLSASKSGNVDNSTAHYMSRKFHWTSQRVFWEKWPMLIKTGKEVAAFSKLGGDISKLREFIMKKHRPAVPQFVMYPYFEKAIPDSLKLALGLAAPWGAHGDKRQWTCERKT